MLTAIFTRDNDGAAPPRHLHRRRRGGQLHARRRPAARRPVGGLGGGARAPARSPGVRALERELGATLFDRTTHRVQLSEAGRALLPEARRTLAAAAAARDAVDQLRGGLRGTVRLGMMLAPRQAGISVPRILAALRADHPGIEVTLDIGASTTNAERVRRGRLDLAFVGLSAGSAPDLELTPLLTEEMRLVVPPEHPLAARGSV